MTTIPEMILPHEYEKIAKVDAIEHRMGSKGILDPLAEHLLAVRATKDASKKVPMPITADCSRKYTAVHHSGIRPIDVIRFVVMHAQESPTAESAASWFTNPASGGSAQLCGDTFVCYRTLPNNYIPWGAPGANYRGFHIEEAGYTDWAADQWPTGTIERSSFKCAQHLRKFHLPLKYLDSQELERLANIGWPSGSGGYTTHLECTRAFGGDHTDPGDGWHHTQFANRTKHWFNAI